MSNLNPKALSRWIIAGSLFFAGSCAPPAVGSASSATPLPSRVLASGFASIQERYLTSVVIGDAAVDGLRGLSSLDPAITLDRPEPRRITLRYQGERVAEYPTPALDDSDGWADFAMTVERDAAGVSPLLAKANDEKVYEAMFDAILTKLDMFSRYAGRDEAKEHRAARDGFGGVGVRYEPHPDDLTLIEVMPDTPAAHAGLHVGDHITEIDGHSVVGLNQDDVTALMRGPISSAVELTLRRQEATASEKVSLNRALIVPPTVSMTMQDGIATIAITSFNRTTAQLTTAAVVKAKTAPGFKGIMLDLRGNPGGLLDQGVEVADLFMDHGRIVSTRGRNPASLQTYDARPGDPGEDVPLVVLVDGKSASAAEIVTSALQDSGRAVVVGTNSYGKGTVQTVIHLPNDGEMTLTWSRYYTPAGYALHGLGILPTVCTADDHAQPALLLQAALDGRNAVTSDIARWRVSPVDDLDGRKLLRSYCPPAKHADIAVDGELGRSLLNDPDLYRRTLSLTAPVATATATAERGTDKIQQH